MGTAAPQLPASDLSGAPLDLNLGPSEPRAQSAPLDLNMGRSEPSGHRWTSTRDLQRSVGTTGPRPGTFQRSVGTCGPQRPDRMPEDMPDITPDRMSDRMPEDMPDKMPEDMPDRMPEDMPDRMPEDLPVTKRINVMVGITRSKVI